MQNSLYQKYLNLLQGKGIPQFLTKYLNTSSLIRLKKICYFCGMDYASKQIYNFKENISRFDHSLTVALLTWNLTQDKIATISSLFHDIATPCFSHVIDYMNKDYANQESTEKNTEEIITNDKLLLQYLKEDNINLQSIVNFKQYSIVDNNRPKLCADRLDGIILTGIAWTKTLNDYDINDIVNNLSIYINEDNEKEIGFKNKDIALKVLQTSNEIDKLCHSNEDSYMMELLAKITKITIENRIIEYKDLYYLDEPTLLNKIKSSNIKELNKLVNKFENIRLDEIPTTKIENIKIRDLNPLVNGIRLNNNKY